ncbi:tetratricopeptide repeat protein [Micromonospora sp. NPDC005203]|uniref:tetratricopeptide repeat protein n=1 Tax=Micromonospora sp. NPDC005203 TaxID=3364226 RepID=UPI00369903D4
MDDQPAPDPTMTRIGEAVQLGRSGQKGPARDTLTALWDEIGPTGDAFHRCTLAHYLADLQDTTEAELTWDERALAAVSDLTDERAQRYLSSLQVQAFLPSLYLNLADCHRRLGNPARAREHLARASDHLVHLPDDPYGEAIRAAVRDFAADDPTDARR